MPVLNTVSIDTSALSSREIDAAASAGGHTGASLYHVDTDLLRELRPDLILTQETCEVCAVSRHDVDMATRTLGYTPEVLSLSPATLEQVIDDIGLVARKAGLRNGVAEKTAADLRARVDDVRRRAAHVERPRVFCMEWLDPPWTAGHWIPEMVDFAGGRDELGTRAGPSRRIDWPEVVGYAPEVIVLIPCSLSLERVAAEFQTVRELPGWRELPAVTTGQVYAGATELFSRSGPRLVDGLEVLARALHPQVSQKPLPPNQALKVSIDGQRLEVFC